MLFNDLFKHVLSKMRIDLPAGLIDRLSVFTDRRQNKGQQLQYRKGKICIARPRQPLRINIGGKDKERKGKQRQKRQKVSFNSH